MSASSSIEDSGNNQNVESTIETFNLLMPPPCVVCGEEFESSETLCSHLQQEHLNNAQSVTNAVEISANQVTNKTKTMVKPPPNEFTTNFEHKLADIACTSANVFVDDLHICQLCGLEVEGLSNLQKHLKLHISGKLYFCEFCDKEFNYKHAMIRHSIDMHGIKPANGNEPAREVKRTLNIYGKSFSQRELETGEPWSGSHKCVKCGNYFAYEKNLQKHLNLNTCEKKTRTCTCEMCGKSFFLTSIERHMRTHTGEKPYSCEICGKEFITSNEVTQHKVVHAKVKPCKTRIFRCEVCMKSLNSQSSLKRHMRTHTGEKPYSCKTCGRNFSSSYNMSRHEVVHHIHTEISYR